MTSLTETVLVVIVVGGAAAWAGRAIWGSIRGTRKGKCSGCSGASDCSAANQPTDLVELSKMEDCGPDTPSCYVTSSKTDNKPTKP